MADSREELRARLNAETAKLEWQELEKHFARGVVIRVSQELDLIEVASRVIDDDKAVVSDWMEKSLVAHPSIEEAQDWVERKPLFWSVVAAPWVLVQEVKAE
ncbi:DUF2288 domain-containing protein [Pseudomonadota bacterium]